MHALVVGHGSEAERRASILTALGHRPARAEVLDSRRFPLPDIALVCGPIDTRVAHAIKLLDLGIPAVFVEQPMASDTARLDALEQACDDAITMTGCKLRFAYNFPRVRWALLEMDCSKPVPLRLAISQPRARDRLEQTIHEFDLAFSLNGQMQAIHTVSRRTALQIGIEHRNLAWSHIEFDWTGQTPRGRALLSAFDDGDALSVPHQPEWVTPSHDYIAQREEVAHFVACAQTGGQPCCTISSGRHVLEWALAAILKKDAPAALGKL